MSDILNELVELLTLERIEENLFRGRSQDLGWGQVFGGQVLGQALSAAAQTVPPERPVHSLHSYFLRPGDVSRGIVYEVDRIRDGKSFTTRRVKAIQNGRAIFNLSASFQTEESGFEHQDSMPEAPGPEGLPSHLELVRRHADRLPATMRAWALADRPIETRPVDPYDPINPQKRPPTRLVWYRSAGALPGDPALHRYMLAYASDFHFLVTSLQPHGVSWLSRGMQVASLDHAMWFHQPFRFDSWLLHVMESPAASGGRGTVRGRFFDQDGALVATAVQEGLIRRWPERG
jgi:acyl-CoA thioesterase-2